MNLFKIDNIGYYVQQMNNRIEILKNISFDIEHGKITGICGESGGGKSTLAKIIAGIINPTSGQITWNNEYSFEKRKSSPVQILFQNNGEILNPFRKIISIIDEALKINGIEKKDIPAERESVLNSVGIKPGLYNRRGIELSGGEQQRAALARLLCVKPFLLILDEPFSAQDIESQLSFVKLFRHLNLSYNLTMICISHDLQILRNITNKIIILRNGEIVETGTTENVFDNPQHPYTKFLLSAESLELSYEDLHSEN